MRWVLEVQILAAAMQDRNTFCFSGVKSFEMPDKEACANLALLLKANTGPNDGITLKPLRIISIQGNTQTTLEV